MKTAIIGLTILTSLLAALYLIIGGAALLIGLSTISLLTLSISCFCLGIWYTHQSIQLGAKIATEAANNNDKWDKALTKFGNEMIKSKSQQSGFSLIETTNSDYNNPFVITGVDNE